MTLALDTAPNCSNAACKDSLDVLKFSFATKMFAALATGAWASASAARMVMMANRHGSKVKRRIGMAEHSR